MGRKAARCYARYPWRAVKVSSEHEAELGRSTLRDPLKGEDNCELIPNRGRGTARNRGFALGLPVKLELTPSEEANQTNQYKQVST